MNELIEFSLDTENGEKNYNLAQWYENQGHTAPAHTYYLRAAERTEDNILAYQSLIRASFCYKSQGSRDGTEKVLLENALMLLPERPESYYFLSLLYEKKGEWQNCYIYANLGLECYSNNIEEIDIPEYPGKYSLIFQKAISGWWWGKGEESRQLLIDLYNNYWNIVGKKYQDLILNNMDKLNIDYEKKIPLEKSKSNQKIIDYFRFFNEKELLELRYHILKDKVDKFVIAQGTRTFSGNPTELLVKKYIKELNLPEDKFIVINVDLPENSETLQNSKIDEVFRSFSGPSTDSYKNSLDTRTRERMVMDGLTSILSEFNDNDIFLVSDCDEIINPKYIDDLVNLSLNNPDKLVKIPLVELQGKANLRVYDLETSTNVTVPNVSYICTKKHFNVCSPTQLRYNIFNCFDTIYLQDKNNRIEECGWHFSWMGDSNRKKLKCKSFAHYSDYIESAEVKDLGSSKMETFFDEWEPTIGGINPWGNKNLILKQYDENELPKEIWNLKNVKDFLLGDSTLKEKTIIDLFLVGNYNTDKYQLGYITEFYNDILHSLKKTPINLLEIGTASGGSARLWRDYFHPNSNITTGDIIECKNKVNGVNYILGDMYSDEIIYQFENNYFDLIIDDGPHTFESFNLLIEKYYSKLKSNGTLIIEDIISESYLSPLIMLAERIGYASYTITNMANKQLNEEWKNDWKNGLYILRIDK